MVQLPDIRRLSDGLRRRGAVLLVLWLLAVLGAVFPYFEATRNANERPRLLQGMALVDEGSWAIDGPAARGLEPGPDVSRSKADGRLYPNKPPGTSLAAAAGYRVARALSDEAKPLDLRTYTWWARLLGGVLPTVLLAWLLIRRLTARFGPAVGAGAVVLYVLGTPAASYAHLLYGHQLAALSLFAGIVLLVDAGAPDVDPRRAMIGAGLGGALAGLSVVVEYGAVFAGVPIAVLLLSRARRPGGLGVLVAGLLGALLPIVLLAAYHDAVYGSPWSTGYHHVTNAEFAAKHGQGLLGLGLPRLDAAHAHLTSADGGLLWWAPTIVIALYGLAQLSLSPSEMRAEARLHLGLVGLYLLLVCSLSFEGGWRVGPRYLVVALPSLAMGWAHALSQLRVKVVLMAVTTALATYAVTVNGLAANLWPHFDLTNIHQPVAEVLLPLWEHDRAPYDLVRDATGGSGLRFAVIGSVVGLWVMLFASAEGGYRMAGGIVGGAVMGLLLVQATHGVEPHPMGKRNLAYIERIWEPTEEGPGSSALLAELPPGQVEGSSAAGESPRIRVRPTPRRRGRSAGGE